MKVVITLFVAGFIALSNGLTEEQMEMIKKISAECVAETGVSHDMVMRAKGGEFDTDPKLAEYFFCMFKKPGFMTEGGEVVVDVIKTTMTEKYGPEVANKVVTDCAGVQGSIHEKSIALAKCLYERKPSM